MFYKKKGSNVYHWYKECSQVPGNVHHDRYWMVLPKYANPSGTACEECTKRGRQGTGFRRI